MVHILRREHVSDNWFSALGWTPESQRAGQRSKTTWKRTIERKINKAGTWDRKCWSESEMNLCAYWQEVMMKMKPRGVKILTRTALSTVLHPAQRTAMI